MNAAPPSSASILKVAVVGHTNTGKTSLMRTLSRDESFGEVSDRPAVTREIEGITLLVAGRPMLELYDTPGLEDSIGLYDHLSAQRTSRHIQDIDVIHQFFDSPEGRTQFAQEAKAIRQLINSDLALYVIDARDRVLGKHRDELAILSMCARPVVPVLNFIAKPEARTSEWRDHLARINLHAVAEFDTVVFDERGEQRLFEKMRTLLPPEKTHAIDALIDDRRRLREQLISNSASLVADLLLDVAAYRIVVDRPDNTQIERTVEHLREAVRLREQQCVDELLRLHRFRHEDCEPEDLPIINGRWGIDLFNPDAMKQFGIRFGSGAAAGATAGLLIDVLTGGLTLGAGTAAGAAIGGAIGGQKFGRRLLDKFRGKSEVRCDDAALLLLEARQIALVHALLHRGHASLQPIRLNVPSPLGSSSPPPPPQPRSPRAALPEPLELARSRPGWSTIGQQHHTNRLDPQYQTAHHVLAGQIEQGIRTRG